MSRPVILSVLAIVGVGCASGLTAPAPSSRRAGNDASLTPTFGGWSLGGDDDLARSSAGYTGCEPSAIYIYNADRPFLGGPTTWSAECEGRTYRCSSTRGNVSCIERGGKAKPTVVVAPAQPARGVRRVKGSSGGYRLEATASDPPFQLTFRGSPTQDRENILLTIKYPTQLVSEACAPSVMVDGQLQPPLGHRLKRTLAESDLQVELPLKVLQLFTRPHRVAGRVCSEEWRLGAADQQQIEEFLVRWGEELKWGEPSTPPDGAHGVDPTSSARPASHLPPGAGPEPR